MGSTERPSKQEIDMSNQSIPVQYTNGDRTPVCTVGQNRIRSRGPAEPTSRALAGSDDQWAAEEWVEPCDVDIDGEWRPASLVYLFRASEVAGQTEDYPWDSSIERVLLKD
jgi:hypothetical protein